MGFERQSEAMTMGRVVILLIISLLSYHPAIVQGVKQFVLNFQQSSNKVIVSDLYYGLEYSIWRGTQEANEFVELLLFYILLDSVILTLVTTSFFVCFILPLFFSLHVPGQLTQMAKKFNQCQ